MIDVVNHATNFSDAMKYDTLVTACVTALSWPFPGCPSRQTDRQFLIGTARSADFLWNVLDAVVRP